MIVQHIERPPRHVVEGFRQLLAFDSITRAISDCLGRFNAMTSDLIVIDGNGVVVVPRADGPEVLERTRRLLETEHVLQAKIKAGATIGELSRVDEVFKSAFSYHDRAAEG